MSISVAPFQIELGHVGEDCNDTPDAITLVFTDSLLNKIVAAQLSLKAMNLGFAEVVMPLPDDLPLTIGGGIWKCAADKVEGGQFDRSSTWLKIQTDSLGIEIWEEHCDDTLAGSDSIANVPGLTEALAARRREVAEQMLVHLN